MRNNQSSLRECRSCPVQIPEGTGSACHRPFGLSVPQTHGCTADGKDELSLQIPTPVCEGVQLERGLPSFRDRAFQALFKLGLEPIAETTADPNSYGFRPKRSCADAIVQCHNVLCQRNSAVWVLEADIKGCFDNISHQWILQHIPLSKKVLTQWLKAGYMEKKHWFPTHRGTPQGGIISPIIANMVL